MPTVAAQTMELLVSGGALAFLAGLAYTIIKKHGASATSSAAIASHTEANTSATEALLNHYDKQIQAYAEKVEKLQSTVDGVTVRLREMETELSKVETMWKYSAAGERRYRKAFAELYKEVSVLLAIAREHGVPDSHLHRVEEKVDCLVAALALPLDETMPQSEGDNEGETY